MADFANLVLGVDTSGLKKADIALKSTAKAAKTTEDAVTKNSDAFKSLRASLDPVYASSKKYEAAQKSVALAVRNGSATQAQANRVLDLARDKYLSTGNGAAAATPKVAAFGAATNTTRAAVAAATRALALFGGAFMAVREISQASQAFANMSNNMRVLGFEAEEVAAQINAIGDIANRTRSPLAATAQLYQRISIAANDLGASQQQVLRFTENVGLALAQQGGSAAEASGALLQLSQAMSGGTVRAEEFNSILEGAFPIAQAAANAIEGAAGSVGQLRNMVIAGEVSSREFFDAILSSSEALEVAFGKTVPTVSQAMTVLSTNFTLFIGQADNLLGISGALAGVIISLANNLDLLAGVAVVAVAAFGVKYVAAFAMARGATGLLSGSLIVLRSALISTGIGALIVGAGVLVGLFSRLVTAAGGFGIALGLLKDVAVESFDRITNAFKIIPLAVKAGALRMAQFFLEKIAEMGASFVDFTWSVADGLNSLFGTSLSGASARAFNEIRFAAMDAESAVGDATSAIGKLSAGISAPMASVSALGAAMSGANEGTAGLAAGLEGVVGAIDGSGGTGAASAIEKAAKAIRDQISALEDAADPLRVFNRGMAELDALKLQGLSDGAYAFAVEELRKQLEQATPEVGKFTQMFKDGMGDAIDYTVNGFKDGFSGLLDIIKSTLLQAAQFAIANPIKLALGIGGTAGASGGLGGGIQGIIGEALGGFGSGGSILGMSGLGGGAGALGGLGNALSGGLGNLFNVGANAAAAGGGLMATLGAAAPMLGIAAAAFSFFKKKTTELDAGVRISVTGMDALVEGYKKIETSRFFGLSKKVADEFEALDAAVADPLKNAVNGVLSNVFDMATGLGVAASTFDDFATSLIVSTKGMTDEQAQTAIQNGLKDISVSFAEMATDLFEFQRHGENAAMILERLSTSVAASNVVMSALGLTLFDLTLGGANAASVFNDAFGSIEALNAISTNYYAKAFSDVERVGMATTAMSGAMSELGVVMPKTIAGFRNLIEQADRLGDMEKVADLLVLFGDFATMIDGQTAIANTNLTAANSNLTTATTDLNAAFSREMAATRDAFQVTIDGLNDDLTGARERLSTSKSIADALSSALDRRVFPSIEAQRQSQDAAAGYLKSLVGVSRIDDVDALQNALRIVADPSTDTFETLADYSRNFDTTSGVISALEKTAGFALSADEQAVNLLQTQIENTQLQSDTQIGLLRAQLDGILGLSNNLMSLGSSISQFAGAQASQQAAAAAVSSVSLGPIEQIYKDVLGRAADAAGLAFYRNNLTAGNSSLQQIRANIAKSSEASTFNSTGVARLPSFDGGGYTGNGSRTGGLDGQGGFLSMMHPQETVTDHTRGGNSKMEAQLDVLNARIEQLTAYSKQTTINTGDASFDLKDIRRNGVRVEPVDGAIFKTDEVA
jgi:tape measure domain-containing protein